MLKNTFSILHTIMYVIINSIHAHLLLIYKSLSYIIDTHTDDIYIQKMTEIEEKNIEEIYKVDPSQENDTTIKETNAFRNMEKLYRVYRNVQNGIYPTDYKNVINLRNIKKNTIKNQEKIIYIGNSIGINSCTNEHEYNFFVPKNYSLPIYEHDNIENQKEASILKDTLDKL